MSEKVEASGGGQETGSDKITVYDNKGATADNLYQTAGEILLSREEEKI